MNENQISEWSDEDLEIDFNNCAHEIMHYLHADTEMIDQIRLEVLYDRYTEMKQEYIKRFGFISNYDTPRKLI